MNKKIILYIIIIVLILVIVGLSQHPFFKTKGRELFIRIFYRVTTFINNLIRSIKYFIERYIISNAINEFEKRKANVERELLQEKQDIEREIKAVKENIIDRIKNFFSSQLQKAQSIF